jgi:hypothetical protein
MEIFVGVILGVFLGVICAAFIYFVPDALSGLQYIYGALWVGTVANFLGQWLPGLSLTAILVAGGVVFLILFNSLGTRDPTVS